MDRRKSDGNLILKLSFEYAVDIIKYSGELEKSRKFKIARQILRSGTSIGANVREAQNAESKADFIHKFKIAAKETDENEYWLLLCQASEEFPKPNGLIEKLDTIAKIINKIVASSKTSTNQLINK